jgi:3-hydroxyacyl-[acyl-carrier-protein] dehydratase
MNGFVLIDRLVELEPGARAVASKTFAAADTLFQDHFPGNPVVPGSLLIEAMAQTAGWLVVATTAFGKAAQLVIVRDAKFRRPVRPESPIALTAAIGSQRGTTFEVSARAVADGELAASAHLVLQTFDIPAGGEADRFVAWARATFRAIGGEALTGGR